MSEQTYYFDSYDIGGDEWETNPEQMVDNNLATFASTIARGGSQVCLTNTCPGVDLGTITKVELRVYAYGDGSDVITPFSIQEDSWGNIHPGTEPGWSSWLDITLLNPPIPWTWATLQSFQVRIVWTNIGKANRMYCAKVEFRVTYTPSAGYYHGLKVQGEGELALCDVGSHPLRVRKGGVTYGLELVATDDPNASRVRIKTGAGIKAIRKYS